MDDLNKFTNARNNKVRLNLLFANFNSLFDIYVLLEALKVGNFANFYLRKIT